MIDLQVKCAMYKKIELNGDSTKRYISYYMYPRSSISKTFIRLANSTGIIDSGYRGNLCAAVDNIAGFGVETAGKHHRYFQICSPTLDPLIVKLVDDISDFETTIRGSGGFGSTGY
jgi:dUTP pyrophosphatase